MWGIAQEGGYTGVAASPIDPYSNHSPTYCAATTTTMAGTDAADAAGADGADKAATAARAAAAAAAAAAANFSLHLLYDPTSSAAVVSKDALLATITARTQSGKKTIPPSVQLSLIPPTHLHVCTRPSGVCIVRVDEKTRSS